MKKFKNKLKNSFTLAEVLIVLTILGIIATISMTTLKPVVFKQKGLLILAKTTIRQIDIALSMVISNDTQGLYKLSTLADGDTQENLANKLKKYLTVARKPKKSEFVVGSSFVLKNGVEIGITKSKSQLAAGTTCIPGEAEPYNEPTTPGWGYITIDTNGSEGPNELCADLFLITVDNRGDVVGENAGDDNGSEVTCDESYQKLVDGKCVIDYENEEYCVVDSNEYKCYYPEGHSSGLFIYIHNVSGTKGHDSYWFPPLTPGEVNGISGIGIYEHNMYGKEGYDIYSFSSSPGEVNGISGLSVYRHNINGMEGYDDYRFPLEAPGEVNGISGVKLYEVVPQADGGIKYNYSISPGKYSETISSDGNLISCSGEVNGVSYSGTNCYKH